MLYYKKGKLMKKYYKYLYLLGFVLMFSGCQNTSPLFVYPSKKLDLVKLNERSIFMKSVAVLPFEDNRENNDPVTFKPENLLTFIPIVGLLFNIENEYNKPEKVFIMHDVHKLQFHGSIMDDLGRAATLSFENTGLFSTVNFEKEKYRSDVDLILTGKIHKFRYSYLFHTFGLSVITPVIGNIISTPMFSSHETILIDLILRDSKSYKTIWSYTIHENDKYWASEYWGPTKTGEGYIYAELMQKGLNKAVLNLEETLRNNPDLLTGKICYPGRLEIDYLNTVYNYKVN